MHEEELNEIKTNEHRLKKKIRTVFYGFLAGCLLILASALFFSHTAVFLSEGAALSFMAYFESGAGFFWGGLVLGLLLCVFSLLRLNRQNKRSRRQLVFEKHSQKRKFQTQVQANELQFSRLLADTKKQHSDQLRQIYRTQATLFNANPTAALDELCTLASSILQATRLHICFFNESGRLDCHSHPPQKAERNSASPEILQFAKLCRTAENVENTHFRKLESGCYTLKNQYLNALASPLQAADEPLGLCWAEKSESKPWDEPTQLLMRHYAQLAAALYKTLRTQEDQKKRTLIYKETLKKAQDTQQQVLNPLLLKEKHREKCLNLLDFGLIFAKTAPPPTDSRENVSETLEIVFANPMAKALLCPKAAPSVQASNPTAALNREDIKQEYVAPLCTDFLHKYTTFRQKNIIQTNEKGDARRLQLNFYPTLNKTTLTGFCLTIRDLTPELGVGAMVLKTSKTHAPDGGQKSTPGFYAKIVEQKDQVISLLDENGLVCYENTAMQRLFGYTPAMRTACYALENVHPEDASAADNLLAQAKRSAGDFTLETRCRWIDRNGNQREVILGIRRLAEAIKVNQSEAVLMLTLKDTGLLNKQDNEKQAQNQLFRALVQHAQHIYLLTDTLGNILFSNRFIEKSLGYDLQHLLGKKIFALTDHQGTGTLRKLIANLQAEPQKSLSGQIKGKTKQNGWRSLQLYAQVIPLKNSQLKGVMFQMEDVTEQLQQQNRTAFYKKLYRTMVENTSTILIFSAYDFQIKYINAAAKYILGYQISGDFTQFLHSEDKKRLEEEKNKILSNKKYVLKYSVRLMDKNGAWIPFRLSARHAHDSTGLEVLFIECVPKNDQ